MRLHTLGKYNWQRMQRDMEMLALTWPRKGQVGELGKSGDGRPLLYMKIGRGPCPLLLTGAHHGREYLSAAYLMETARALLKEETFLTKGAARLATYYIVPMVNPDGVEISIKGRRAASAYVRSLPRKGPWSAWKADGAGVDLNRQYPCRFEAKMGQVPGPASEGWPGKGPATQPEVQAVMELCRRVPFRAAINFHTKGEEIFYGDTNTPGLIPQSAAWAGVLCESSGYAPAPVSRDPAAYGGGMENWFRQEFDRPAFLVELTPPGGPRPWPMWLLRETLRKAGDIPFLLAFLGEEQG